MHFDALREPRHHTSEEIEIVSVGISDSPRRNEQILRNFDLLLPKFHFILPKFHFPSPWGIFVCSLEIPDFLRRDPNHQRRLSSQIGYLPLYRDTRSVCLGLSQAYLLEDSLSYVSPATLLQRTVHQSGNVRGDIRECFFCTFAVYIPFGACCRGNGLLFSRLQHTTYV